MDANKIPGMTEQKLKASVEHFSEDLKKLRTGRAHPSMLDGVMAEAYGTPMPLNQLATISAPEPQLIQITPFDPAILQSISTAIRDNHSLGMNPSDDGRIVRVPIPPLTTERRQEIVKQLNAKMEDCFIAQRSIRRDVMTDLDEAKKDKDISEDEHKRLTKQIDDLMTRYKMNVEELSRSKEAEILTV